jgi:hypothetical protein
VKRSQCTWLTPHECAYKCAEPRCVRAHEENSGSTPTQESRIYCYAN